MMIMVDKLKKISEKPWFYPVALLLMAFVTYRYTLTSLGYYWSDWEIVMFTKLNPAFQFGFFAEDRPFPWTYQLIYSLVGSKPIGWHIVTLLIRWGGTLFFVYALILFWPRYKKQIFWLGALLIVYPGFLQQTQSATKARHIMTLFLFALSLYLMALALKRPKWAQVLFPLSWIATFMHLFTTEYFSGIELMRPVLIWMLVAGEDDNNAHVLHKVAINSLPYLLITAFFIWARFVYFPSTFQTSSRLGNIGSTVGGFQESFLDSLLNLFNRALMDLLYSTGQVWTNAILRLDGFTFARRIAWFAFGVGAFFAVAFFIFYNTNEDERSDRSTPISIILIGFLLFVMSALPIWAIGKDVSSGGWNDRFSLAPMLGATLMAMGLVLALVRPGGQRWIFGFFLMFSIATQIWVVNSHRRDWVTQRDYFWQLYWRMPALQPGTVVFSFEQPSVMVSHDHDSTWAINILYHYWTEDGSLPYMFITPEKEIYLQPDTDFTYPVRNLVFSGNTSNSVAVLHQTNDSCLRVLDPIYLYDPLLHEGHDRLIPLSNPSRIIPDSVPVPPDTDIFGPEPAHTWCYFFQKADLARQTQDWDKVLDLYDEAQKLGLGPEYGAEYIPFIEAYARTGDWQRAYELTVTADALTLSHKKMLCANWIRLSTMPSADMGMFERVDQYLSC